MRYLAIIQCTKGWKKIPQRLLTTAALLVDATASNEVKPGEGTLSSRSAMFITTWTAALVTTSSFK